eukprot:gene6959-7035_t
MIRAAKTVQIQGGGSKALLGRPVTAEAVLSTAALTGITLYEPAEMVISARAGTPLSEIEEVIAAKGQMLPFEPMDYRGVLGTSGAPTIGGLAACNLSGPRRIAAGAARDSILGLRLVNGLGEIVKTGGRVMKNVTGLDLVKVNCGAYGTLALITEVTIKLLPRPQKAITFVIKGLEDVQAVDVLSQALGSPFEVSGAAHLPFGLGRNISRTLMRLENFDESIAYRIGELRKMFAGHAEINVLEGEHSERIWRGVRDVDFINAPAENIIWRISTAPHAGPKLMADMKHLGGTHYYDWSGGLIWLSLAAPHTRAVREAVKAYGGHATLARAPADVRAHDAVFQPLDPRLMALTASIKTSFDPEHKLNPGHMYSGI